MRRRPDRWPLDPFGVDGALGPPAGERHGVFVPAVMTVGLLFWLAGETLEALRSQQARRRHKQTAIIGRDLAGRTVAGRRDRRSASGLRPRPFYLVAGAFVTTVGVYVGLGSTLNYLRADGYVSDIAWLLALALIATTVLIALGVASLMTWKSYPDAPGPLRRLLLRSPLTTMPDGEEGPSWRLLSTLVAAWAGYGVLSMIVGISPHVVDDLDGSLFDRARARPLPGPTTLLDLAGAPLAGALVIAVAVLLARRCRVLLIAAPAVALAGQLLRAISAALVGHPSPPGPLAGRLDSYPSGDIALLAFLSLLVPLALVIAGHRRWPLWPARALLGFVTLSVAYHRVAAGERWPTDVVGGLLLGVALAVSVEWALALRRLHRRCLPGCEYCTDVAVTPDAVHHGLVGAIVLPAGAVARLRIAARVSTAAAALGLVVLSYLQGVPTNPESSGLRGAIERPAQLGLAALVSVAALISWRWPAAAAVMLAVSASGLGTFAGVEYQPAWGIALALALMVPAVLTWLSWQHERRRVEIAGVAVLTLTLVVGTWVGASTVYDGYFGPTHPESLTAIVPVDRVDWLWTGSLSSTGIAINAHLDGDGGTVVAVAIDVASGAQFRSPPAGPDADGVVALRLGELVADRDYRFVLEVDGEADTGRGSGTFHTPPDGPFSFRLAVASCERTGSNGQVFDAIAATDPLMFLQIGDLHYQNLTDTEPGPFVDAVGLQLRQPAQVALARQVPYAYIWDDHDYGANNATGSSPTRDAARAAYRAAAPHYPLPSPDGAIYQAFTIGRVRIVMTDTRSERTDTDMISADQERWLVDELTTAAAGHALVLWAASTPWIGAAGSNPDTWAAAAAQRTRIADALAAAGVDNLVMVAGDAHMVAIDDGTNTAYATDGSPGFPLLQAAALDRPGAVKGGPYSEGTFPGGGRFGLVDIDDHGDTIDVRLSGVLWDGSEIVALERTFPAGDVPR